MMLEKCHEFLHAMISLCQLLPDNDETHGIVQKLRLLEEDLNTTEESFIAKDALKEKSIIKATVKYANQYYRAREYELCDLLTRALARQPDSFTKAIQDEIARLKSQMQQGSVYSFNNQEGFKNPYPSYLFFSQAKHASHFSGKSLRAGVAGEDIDAVAHKLRTGEILPEYLRVNIYLAPFRGKLHPFVYNNRTWVVFSRAKIDASRIIPLVPNQDLLNRIAKLDPMHYPNAILDEDAPVKMLTESMRPGPKLY